MKIEPQLYQQMQDANSNWLIIEVASIYSQE